ncbi:MAG TPA: MsnO8 family LLM class oxidoreductase [Opitutaceae bacterium]|jgi:luciferase family oxidoreductase group 1|nr:MsnO8 family LLM class oxidoreductase [Opitutaceae bacterium]
MKLSVLEQSALSEGSSAAEAISNTVALSKEIDRLGYNRIWLSEHHNLSILQGSTPEVLLAAIGAQTTRIRLGTGGVMLPNHSAYHIAENFRTLEALYPGRMDCGIGRASGGDSYSRSLLVPSPDAWGDFTDQADQLAGYFHDACKRAFAMPLVASAPPIWLLSAGSNPASGKLAAEKGMGLAVALFINPDASAEAARQYKQHFRPSKEFPEPRVMIAVNAVVAPTAEKLQELKKTSDFLRLMRDSGRYPSFIPASEKMKDVHFGANEKAYLGSIANREVIGLPGEAKQKILERAKAYDADEVLLTMTTHRLSDKIEGYRLLAEAFSTE